MTDQPKNPTFTLQNTMKVDNIKIAHFRRHIDEALQYQRDYGAKSKSVFLFSLLNIGEFFW
jgi:hypothetical protein